MAPRKASAAAKAASADTKVTKKAVATPAAKRAATPKASTTTTATKKAAASKEAAPKKAAAAKKASTPAPAKRAATPAAKQRAGSAKPTTNGTTAAPKSKKRKAEEDEESDAVPETKKAKKSAVKKEPTPAPTEPEDKRPKVAIGPKINEAPTTVLDVYVFGEGTSGELGLGSRRVNGKKPIDVKRPRLNENLSAEKTGVVQISCGGMHVVALTRDNKILTWGVNDQGALGRDTTWDGGLKDMDKAASEDSDSEDDDDDTGMNPHESTPAAVSEDYFAKDTKFAQVIGCDSASFALTEDGRVYGWGTFRSSDGILGFTETIKIQPTPILLPTLKNIKSLAKGANHVLALDHKGNVLAWGCGQQNQLGRRIIERNKLSSLIPQGVGLPRGKIVRIACGSYHSFAIDTSGQLWGWGLNNFGEVGVEGNAGENDAVILRPVKITALTDHIIRDIEGGGHHSVACNEKGELLTWGRVDGHQVGIDPSTLTEENAIFDDRKVPRILFVPTVVPDISNVVAVAAGFDNSFAVTADGRAFSWGFSSNYQTGQGTIDDIEKPTHIDNTAIRGKKIIGAGAGGQYSILIGKAEGVVNGA
ncbi:GDP/GTP exchange factor [Emericellopsis atlantica]|uniref:GDP/GTP exchange factor n=1 Tax=Emericellopsis atlantica TaxID=2614577 RepID=A0A9P8CTJ1_9HYPO|nr:GDP/GTP exchange factor [Emericellopsis atlantica]KAG9256876.1 GDP/GTP exchange factor [Emericellopsis atlantica]